MVSQMLAAMQHAHASYGIAQHCAMGFCAGRHIVAICDRQCHGLCEGACLLLLLCKLLGSLLLCQRKFVQFYWGETG